jgi:hypothetical protein
VRNQHLPCASAKWCRRPPGPRRHRLRPLGQPSQRPNGGTNPRPLPHPHPGPKPGLNSRSAAWSSCNPTNGSWRRRRACSLRPLVAAKGRPYRPGARSAPPAHRSGGWSAAGQPERLIPAGRSVRSHGPWPAATEPSTDIPLARPLTFSRRSTPSVVNPSVVKGNVGGRGKPFSDSVSPSSPTTPAPGSSNTTASNPEEACQGSSPAQRHAAAAGRRLGPDRAGTGCSRRPRRGSRRRRSHAGGWRVADDGRRRIRFRGGPAGSGHPGKQLDGRLGRQDVQVDQSCPLQPGQAAPAGHQHPAARAPRR